MQANKTLLTHFLLATVLLAPSAALAQTKVAVIDTAKALTDSVAGKRAEDELRRLSKKRYDELDAKREDAKRSEDALMKDVAAGKLSPAVLENRRRELEKRISEIQTLASEVRRGLEERRTVLHEPLLKAIAAETTRLATAKGVALVVDASAVRYMEPQLDLTADVVQALNATPTK